MATTAESPRAAGSADSSQPQRVGPLAHIRVLDMGRIMAAPWATQIFADLGADVIKIERPGVGDDTRGWGPPFLKSPDGATAGDAGYFLSVNRGKRSVTVDITKPEGQEIIHRLAATADVAIENFKAGTLERYRLDAASLRAVNPRLVYCSVTGFGQDGPRHEQAAYDFAIQAMGGLMSVTGERDDLPGGGPQKVGLPIVDIMTGMYAAVAVLAALTRRAETGQGETIDLAMLDVQAAVLANQAMNWMLSGRTPKRGGNRHPNIQPQDVFPCADGHLVLAVGNDGQFARLCSVLERSEWASDERFSSNAARVRNNAVLTALLSERFRMVGRAELIKALDAVGVPCAPINDIPQVFDDPQIRHREMRRDLPHPVAGTVPQVVSPLRFADEPLRFDRAPPLLGQHTRDILAELGLDDAAQSELAARGVT
ncbi:MAG: CoA transferase [Rhodoplanes sp.]|uniref:CaiB/BaiF CoA transferase family protein n=1 Tax=Rhodoplanes sp. TaxID=1968906 RepID=UPI00179BC90B|nr:CaiB/BaiF CoA-transferase family protein [Rhodoplanes sp.]NVO16912.1 CoA transferase [Rhodoplanes sp.]